MRPTCPLLWRNREYLLLWREQMPSTICAGVSQLALCSSSRSLSSGSAHEHGAAFCRH
jgi:hypothetical protein